MGEGGLRPALSVLCVILCGRHWGVAVIDATLLTGEVLCVIMCGRHWGVAVIDARWLTGDRCTPCHGRAWGVVKDAGQFERPDLVLPEDLQGDR
jgi:hypothetical protein